MNLFDSILSSMGPVPLFISSIIALAIIVFLLRAIWFSSQQEKPLKSSDVKNIYVVSMENSRPDDSGLTVKDSKISTNKNKEKRRFPRYDFESQVEFIKDGKLFKETSRDLSHTGLFLKTMMPDKYSVSDKVMLTFHHPNQGPQKRNGYIVRKARNGIGIHFAN
ncbi:MAG: PilZ domain-containing protein [Desulfobacterales bacterium]|nr:PilZ domain-containing protein [Desulfobacterales bacterium]